MSWIAAAVIGGSLISGVIGGNAADSAAQTQAGAANNATALQQQIWQQNQKNVQPWLQAGTGSLFALQRALGLTSPASPVGAPGAVGGRALRPGGTMPTSAVGGVAQPGMPGIPMSAGASDLTSILGNTPGYQWDLSQGLDAILNKASATGGVGGGNTLKALSDYAINSANNEYNSYISDLFNLSGVGANAALGVAGIGTNVGGQIGSNTIGAGNALAAGQIGSANAITGGVGNAFNNFLMYQALQQQTPSYLNGPTLDQSVFSR